MKIERRMLAAALVTIGLSTRMATAIQNRTQLGPMTKAMPPRMNATMAKVLPVQAAVVRPWWTCLGGRSLASVASVPTA